MKFIKYLALPLCVALLASCSDDENYDNPSGETFIYDLVISNGGMTGAETINGEYDEQTSTYSFVIPAETDIEGIKFTSKLSLGAHLDKDSYDATSGKTDITVVNGQNSSVYHVNFSLLDPVNSPIVRSITCRTADGEERTGFVSDVTGTLYLNCEGSATAEIVDIQLLPKRTSYTFSDIAGKTVSAENPGTVTLDFLGLTTTYDVSFSGVPTFGADFSEALVFDYSANANLWPDFAAENTRWSQFDGESFFYLSREGGTLPSVIKFDDVKAGSPVAKVLDTTGIAGGTFTISSGGIAQGHFYCCNLTTAMGPDSPLKVYHWADETATCETLLTFEGNDNVKGRWGDNMSVTIDENGNGWLWFFAHVDGSQAVRFRVEGFTAVTTEPEVLTPPFSVAYYATINPVIGEDGVYVLTSSYQRTILLVDENLNLLNRIDPKEGCEFPAVGDMDARVINYSGERYLITCSGNGWNYSKPQTLRIYDISDGMNTIMGFTSYSEGDHPVLWSYSLAGARCSAWSAHTGAGIGPDGKLRIMAAAPRAGFVMVETDKKK